MTIEVTDYQLKKLATITRKCIYDDKSFEDAFYQLFVMYSNQRKNIRYLIEECNKAGIKTMLN